MSQLLKQAGDTFVVVIIQRDGSFFVDCLLRGQPPAPGFLPETRELYNNEQLPSFPSMPELQAKKIAIDLAGCYGYGADEIVWDL